MAYLNATTAANRVKLFLIKNAACATPGTPIEADFYTAVSNTTGAATLNTTTDPILVGGLQDITINNAAGSFRWKTLESDGENVITTVSTNSLSGNFVMDQADFFGDSTDTAGTAGADGIFKIGNERTEVAFLIAPTGVVDNQTVLMGTGFISALAPTVSADSPVWVSPITVEVNGSFTLFKTTLGA